MHFDENVHKKLKTIGKNLNLRTHLVSKSKTEMALCGDIEVHKISENNEVLYVLGLAFHLHILLNTNSINFDL